MKLTAKAIASLQLPAGKTDAIYFDDGMPGFGYRLRMGAGGKMLRSWVVQYKHAGVTRRLLLGPGEVLRAEQARTWPKALGAVANGTDPQAAKPDRAAKDRHTLKATVADFLEIKRREVRPRTYYEQTRYLSGDQYFKPLFGLALDQITRKDVASRLTRIKLDSGAVVASRARAHLSGLFAWALTQGLCEVNPVIGTERLKNGKPRERVLSDAEVAAIWKACGDDDHGKIVKLLVLTGCRRAEIGGMCWSEIDRGQGVWTLPESRSKNKTAHTLPLLPTMSRSSRACRTWRARSAIWSARRRVHGWERGKEALDARLDLADWTLHDIPTNRGHADGRSRHHAAHHRANFEPSKRPQGRHRGDLQSHQLRTRGAQRAAAVARPCPRHGRGRQAQNYHHASRVSLDAEIGIA